jgi:membrane associated rhomboid family serine protease
MSDESPSRSFPIITIGIIVLNAIMFLYELSLGDAVAQFVLAAGVVPAEYACRCDMPPTDVGPFWVTLFTSMWLHGGWLHIIGNMVYLWIFGNNIEDAFGPIGYILFYVASGIAAGLTQIVAGPGSTVPAIGASGAIAGVLAAYVVMFPANQIRTLFFLGRFLTTGRIPALVLIGLWFLLQLFNGVASVGDTAAASDGVAYWAHIGGFLFGLVVTLAMTATRGGMPASRSGVR